MHSALCYDYLYSCAMSTFDFIARSREPRVVKTESSIALSPNVIISCRLVLQSLPPPLPLPLPLPLRSSVSRARRAHDNSFSMTLTTVSAGNIPSVRNAGLDISGETNTNVGNP